MKPMDMLRPLAFRKLLLRPRKLRIEVGFLKSRVDISLSRHRIEDSIETPGRRKNPGDENTDSSPGTGAGSRSPAADAI